MKSSQVLFFLLVALLKGAVYPQVSLADTKPCRGFVGTLYTRARLIALCGQPDEILEQETKRLILWRYKGYPYVVVRGSRVDSYETVSRTAQLKRGGEDTKSGVDGELFRTILDEASAQSKEGDAPK